MLCFPDSSCLCFNICHCKNNVSLSLHFYLLILVLGGQVSVYKCFWSLFVFLIPMQYGHNSHIGYHIVLMSGSAWMQANTHD